MERQTTTASTPPANRRDIPSVRPVLSRPTTPQPQYHIHPPPHSHPLPPPQTEAGLSTSEPTLRFPRPQGNRYLASWISASNPDIMRMNTTTEDTGLSESTYELISTADTESQDEHYNESISESVGSLDFHRPEDVQSLAGTEHTNDDDDSAIDEMESRSAVTPLSDDGDHSDDINKTRSQLETLLVSDDDDYEKTVLDHSQTPHDSESDEEARSRSSLEYTQHSLKTPSLLTPEGSKIFERRPVDGGFRAKVDRAVQRAWEIQASAMEHVVEFASAALPGLIFAVLVAFFSSFMYHPAPQDATSQVSTTVTTITATTAPVIASSTKLHDSARTAATSSGNGMDLIPLDDAASDEWLFGPKKPAVSFTPQAQGDILVHVSKSIKKHWLAKGCLTVKATRGELNVDTTLSPVEDGILLKFPRRETHGVVNLALRATCRPKMEKVVKVHFGKGIMEEAFEMTRHLAHDLSELVPAAAQGVERYIGSAKRSFGSASDKVGQNTQSASNQVVKNFGAALAGTRKSLDVVKSDALNCATSVTQQLKKRFESITVEVPSALDVQDQLELGLLDAQIAAKVWWLKVSGQKAEHDTYQRKARDFMSRKQAQVKEAIRARRPSTAKQASRSWTSMMRSGRCQSNGAGRGRSGTHECKVAA